MWTDLDRPLPAAVDAEKQILGCLLDGALQFPDVSLKPNDFSLEKHRRIFLRIGELYEAGESVNRLTVFHRLEALGQAEACDGLSYLAELASDAVATSGTLDSYMRLVK